jgi:ribonucleoside-diphosphate reductase alpha chain
MNSIDTKPLMASGKFYESYSRYEPSTHSYETWEQSVDRVMEMHKDYYKEKIADNPKLLDYFDFASGKYKQRKVLGAQRALQFGGEQLLKHQMKMYNCTSSYADRAEFFGEYFYILLCGSGAGFSVQKHHVAKLPNVVLPSKQAKIHVVDDSIEGWATALDVLMSSYLDNGVRHPEYQGRKVLFDLKQIRKKNSYISGGFKAPGPEPLRKALDRIDIILYNAAIEERQLKTIEVYDICMHTADSVLAGGVRRSATICLFSLDDEEMINSKTGNWFQENPQRGRSNNSAVVVRSTITSEKFHWIMQKVREYGEPGFVFVDSTEQCFNPCVEIGMLPNIDGKSGWQGCNLTEINGGMCDTPELFYEACKAAAILGTLQAGYTSFKFVTEITKQIFEREALLGCSITGWMNNPDVLFDPAVLRKGAHIILRWNKKIAELLGINPAARATCVKPSGNASVLLMTASGIGGEHSERYFRNVQMTKDSEVSKAIKTRNPLMVEESIWSSEKNDYVISFPSISKEGSIYKSELYGVKQLEKVKLAQQHWVENGTDLDLCVDKTVRHNVSNTIVVDDWDEVERYVFENRQYFAGISFLPMSGDKIYYQAPFTEVLTHEAIVDKYGVASLFASGLIVDGISVFDNLWIACETGHPEHNNGEDLSVETHHQPAKKEWCRRFVQFADQYFNSDYDRCANCLKDVYLLHKWVKIQNNLTKVDWLEELGEKQYIDIDTTGAASCVGVNGCEIDF